MSVLRNKPVFTLNIHAFNTSYLVLLNGVAVHTEFSDDGQVTMSLPVNHWMHPEENILGLDILPPEPGDPVNANANVTLELQVHTAGNKESAKTVATLVFEEKHLKEAGPAKNSTFAGRYSAQNDIISDDNGEIVVSEVTAAPRDDYEGAVLYERKLTIPSSLPLWAFFRGDTLPDYHAMNDEDHFAARDDLLVEYQKIQSAFESADIDSIMPLFEERSSETDAAFYLDPGTTQKELREDFYDALNNADLEVVKLVPDYVGISLEENKKLVSLTRNEDQSALRFNFKSRTGSIGYHLIYRKESGKWIITR